MTDDSTARDDIERVKDALPDLADYIRHHARHTADVPTDGSNFAHPVHGSSTGQNLSVDGGRWYCFSAGCECGGDTLGYFALDRGIVESCAEASKLRGMDFADTLTSAAEEFGVELDGRTKAAESVYRERKRLDNIFEDACAFFEGQMKPSIVDWLTDNYPFTAESIEEDRIGFAPDDGSLLVAHLFGLGYDEDAIVEAGLGVRPTDDDGNPAGAGVRDFFRGRVMFPYIEDGCVRYFIGRDPDPDDGVPKYIKHRTPKRHDEISDELVEPVFGIDTVPRVRGEPVVITEGVTDVLGLHEAGFPAVAPVTTSFSSDAIDRAANALRGHNIVVVFDEDAETNAGIRGALRTADALVESGGPSSVRVGRLPADSGESVDVADVLSRSDGERIVSGVVADAVHLPGARYRWGDEQDVVDLYIASCLDAGVDPSDVSRYTDEDGTEHSRGVDDILTHGSDLRRAYYEFEDRQNQLDGVKRQSVHAEVVKSGLDSRGAWFIADGETLMYFYEPERQVYTVDPSDGRRTVSREFNGLIREVFGLEVSGWSANLMTAVTDDVRRVAPRRDVHSFAHWNAERGCLYINRYDSHYYRLDGESIDLRHNGEDVFFQSPSSSTAYEYKEIGSRTDLPADLPGERPTWFSSGDEVMRLLPNRINYSEDAALAPSQQRDQLYIHLHALPFISMLHARPIMAWVGQKGSGKTVVQRSIGKFLVGSNWRESTMPANQDGLVTKATNMPFTFIDNYDDGVSWANDVLAAIATGGGVEKRELFTTNRLASYNPETWMSMTSRSPPFRRDDVADRCLVFRVERIDTDGSKFVPERAYYGQIDEYRDTLWSCYLDNLTRVIEVVNDVGLVGDTTHRMSDWAILAEHIAAALDVDDVEDLLSTMETEQATFALEQEPIGQAVDHFVRSKPSVASEWHTASELMKELNDVVESERLELIDVQSPAGFGMKMTQLRSELTELYSLEVKDERPKRYRFDVETGPSRSSLGAY